MSQTETHIGKCQLVAKEKEESLQDLLIRLIKSQSPSSDTSGLDLEELKELFIYELDNYEKYFIACDNLYEVIENKELDGYDVIQASKNEDGTINYTLRFYNGGTCFSECIVSAIESIEKKSKNITG